MNLFKTGQYKLHIFPILILVGYLLPYIFLKGSSYFPIVDTLDGCVPNFKVLAESGKIFSSNNEIIPNMLSGIPRVSLGSEFNFLLWFHYFFSSINVLIINKVLTTITAYLGMFYLLEILFLKSDIKPLNYVIIIGVALCFSILPFWPYGGLSVAGQPLLIVCLYHLYYKTQNYKHYLYIIFFALYSSFVLSGLFILSVIMLFILIDYIRTRELKFALYSGTFLLLISYIIIEYRLFLNHFNPEFTPHRNEFYEIGTNTLIEPFWMILKGSQMHAESVPKIIWIVLINSLIIGAFFKKDRKLWRTLIISTIIILAINFIFSLWHYKEFRLYIIEFEIAKSFQFDRYYFLLPTLFYTSFAIALLIVNDIRIKFKRVLPILILTILVLQFFLILKQDININKNLRVKVLNKQIEYPNFNEYYAEGLFNQIKAYFKGNHQSFYVAHVGIDPAVSIFNGFYTIDGYMSLYPLDIKHRFIEINKDELLNNKINYQYLKNWGSRLYICPEENNCLGVSSFIFKNEDKRIGPLDINFTKLKDLNCLYIFSAIPLVNKELTLEKIFTGNPSVWNVFIYRIN